MLKHAAVFFLLVPGILFAQSPETAYAALRSLKAAKGDAILDQLVEMKGERGDPQPDSWTVLMKDSSARGGVRELVLTGTSITSERTPISGFAGFSEKPVLNFTRLNLDSDGAFKLANAEAGKAGVGFHWISYELRSQAGTDTPIWVLRLQDYMGAPVGELQVSAENGQITQPLKLDSDRRPDSNVSATSETQSWDERGGLVGVVENTAKTTGRKVSNTTLRVVGNVQEFLTGRRTIGPEENEE